MLLVVNNEQNFRTILAYLGQSDERFWCHQTKLPSAARFICPYNSVTSLLPQSCSSTFWLQAHSSIVDQLGVRLSSATELATPYYTLISSPNSQFSFPFLRLQTPICLLIASIPCSSPPIVSIGCQAFWISPPCVPCLLSFESHRIDYRFRATVSGSFPYAWELTSQLSSSLSLKFDSKHSKTRLSCYSVGSAVHGRVIPD